MSGAHGAHGAYGARPAPGPKRGAPRAPAFLVVAALSLVASCRVELGPPAQARDCDDDAAPSGRVVLYTSAYREVVDALLALAKTELPAVEIEVFQGGSEKVATRLDADLAAGRARADVLLTSDPFNYRRLAAEGQLLPYASPSATPIPRALVDLDNTFATARISTMVIAWHKDRPGKDGPPRSFAELFHADRARDVAFGDPLSSGTYFMTTVAISGGGPPSFLATLKRNGAAVGGGNSVVLQRVLSGERTWCAVLIENVLDARARGEPVEFAVPTDGAVVIPGEVAILKDTQNPKAARAVVDLLLSPAGQKIMRDVGYMHAADPRVPPPESAPPLEALLAARPLDDALLRRVAGARAEVVEQIHHTLEGTLEGTAGP